MGITLMLGIIGTVTGVGSLAWQVVTWRISGPVVKVTVVQHVPPPLWTPSLLADLAREADLVDFEPREQSFPVTVVTAMNTGRSPITVTGIGLRTRDGQDIPAGAFREGSGKLPFRLQPGTNGSWSFLTKDVKYEGWKLGIEQLDLTAYVNLADGQIVYAKRRGIGVR